ncbi:MAG: universal stress protein E [Moritella dasanensis]|jgi:universal stress protein E
MMEVSKMKRFKDILCVVESGEDCKIVLTRAVALAENNQASLTVISVMPRVKGGIRMPKGSSFLANLEAEMVNSRTQELEMLIEPYRKQIKIESKVLVGTPFLMIIRDVLRNDHDLLIKTPEQQERFARFFGSDDMHLLRKCPCPVWLIKQEAPKSYGRILAAVDIDEMSSAVDQQTQQSINQHILQMAGSLALSEFAELHVANAWDVMGESTLRHSAFSRTPEEEINAYVELTRQKHAESLSALLHEHQNDILDYLAPQTHLLKGLARKEIPAFAKRIEADMIVMGTVARIGIPGFIMGNTAETILNQLDCSVLAIKPPGFITPVELED